ncbi:MAG: hypothetical protein WCP35_07630 [Verrucomicrobiota bacterium]
MKSRFSIRRILLTLALAATASPTAHATNANWTGGGTDALWSNAANWGGITPVSTRATAMTLTINTGNYTPTTINQALLLCSAAVVIEYSGIMAVSPVDQTAASAANSTAAVTGTTTITTQANELWLGAISIANAKRSLSPPMATCSRWWLPQSPEPPRPMLSAMLSKKLSAHQELPVPVAQWSTKPTMGPVLSPPSRRPRQPRSPYQDRRRLTTL